MESWRRGRSPKRGLIWWRKTTTVVVAVSLKLWFWIMVEAPKKHWLNFQECHACMPFSYCFHTVFKLRDNSCVDADNQCRPYLQSLAECAHPWMKGSVSAVGPTCCGWWWSARPKPPRMEKTQRHRSHSLTSWLEPAEILLLRWRTFLVDDVERQLWG